MRPNIGAHLGGGRPVVTFIGATVGRRVDSEAAFNVTLPAGAASGDLCYLAFGYNQTVSPSGFTMLSDWALATQGGQWMRHGYKVLTGTDITNGYITVPSTAAGAGILLAVFRGGSSITFVGQTENNTGGASTVTGPNYTNSSSVLTAFSVGCDRDLAANWSVGGNYQMRAQPAASSVYGLALATEDDRTDGNGCAWSGMGTSYTNAAATFTIQ